MHRYYINVYRQVYTNEPKYYKMLLLSSVFKGNIELLGTEKERIKVHFKARQAYISCIKLTQSRLYPTFACIKEVFPISPF